MRLRLFFDQSTSQKRDQFNNFRDLLCAYHSPSRLVVTGEPDIAGILLYVAAAHPDCPACSAGEQEAYEYPLVSNNSGRHNRGFTLAHQGRIYPYRRFHSLLYFSILDTQTGSAVTKNNDKAFSLGFAGIIWTRSANEPDLSIHQLRSSRSIHHKRVQRIGLQAGPQKPTQDQTGHTQTICDNGAGVFAESLFS